jgi:hypothetical protein
VADTIEKRVSDLEEMVGDIPRLINIRFAHTRAQLDAIDARIGTLEVKIDRSDARLVSAEQGLGEVRQRLATVETKIDALPRVIAEMLDERDRRKS